MHIIEMVGAASPPGTLQKIDLMLARAPWAGRE